MSEETEGTAEQSGRTGVTAILITVITYVVFSVAALAYAGIDDSNDDGSRRKSVGGFCEQVGCGGDIEGGVGVGKIENFGGRGDCFDGSLELGHVRVTGTEVGKEGNQLRHRTGRLASGKERGKGKEQNKDSVHNYSFPVSPDLISSQNFGFSARSSSSERGSWDRKAKSLREFLWRTR
jgi:hypothetical protein